MSQNRTEPPKSLSLDLGSGVSMKLVLIPAGKFLMGSPASEKGDWDDERPQHAVTITRPFYLGACAVTQGQYERVAGKNPSQFKGEQNPVDSVSWNDAEAFCKKLSAKTGKTVRLPTEAQWEYACRAGTTTRFFFGDSDSPLGGYAWFVTNSNYTTHPAGQKKPNAWGLYDISGNVWEWCSDWYGPKDYASSSASPSGAKDRDPTGPASGTYRVRRGGSWCYPSWFCRSAVRGRHRPDDRYGDSGFRVAVLAGGG